MIKLNKTPTLPLFEHTVEVLEEIEAMVDAGQTVIVPEYSVVYHNWTGTGYLVLDPETGATGARIVGGLAGGQIALLMDCIENIAQFMTVAHIPDSVPGKDLIGTLTQFLQYVASLGDIQAALEDPVTSEQLLASADFVAEKLSLTDCPLCEVITVSIDKVVTFFNVNHLLDSTTRDIEFTPLEHCAFVQIVQSDPVFLINQARTIWANANPDNGAFLWTTSDPSILAIESSETEREVTIRAVAIGAAIIRVMFTLPSSVTVDDNVQVTVVGPEIKLETVGDTTIESGNNYSENTTLRATVIFPSGDPQAGQTVTDFNEAITFTEESGTIYYNGQSGATALPQDVTAINGIATLTIKSVSNTTNFNGPPDARIKATAAMASQDVGTNPLNVSQWVKDAKGLIKWLDLQANDRLTHFQSLSGIVGTVAKLVTDITQTSGGCGGTTIDQTAIGVSPICGDPNRHRLNINFELSDTVIHEARHVWQHAQENAPLGTGTTPTNDSDNDHCPEAVPAASEAGAGDSTPIIDGTFPSTGDNSPDLPYASFCQIIFEANASDFGPAHKAD